MGAFVTIECQMRLLQSSILVSQNHSLHPLAFFTTRSSFGVAHHPFKNEVASFVERSSMPRVNWHTIFCHTFNFPLFCRTNGIVFDDISVGLYIPCNPYSYGLTDRYGVCNLYVAEKVTTNGNIRPHIIDAFGTSQRPNQPRRR